MKKLPDRVLLAPGRRLELSAAGSGTDGKPAPRRFTQLAYSGEEVSFFGTRVVFDLAGMKAADQSIPILREHDALRIAGFSEKIEIGKEVGVSGVLSASTDAGREVASLGDEGFPWQASVGLELQRVERVEPGVTVKLNDRTFKGPMYVVRQSLLRESSIVALGKDAGTQTALLSAFDHKETVMEKEVETETKPAKLSFDTLTIAEFKAAAPKLYALICEEVLRDDRARASKIAERIQASGLPQECRDGLLRQCAQFSFEAAERIVEGVEGIEGALAAGRVALKAAGLPEAEIEKDLKALRGDLTGLSRQASVRAVETFVDARGKLGKRIVTSGDQAVSGQDTGADAQLAAAVKEARDGFKKVEGSIMGLTEKDFVAQALSDKRIACPEAKLAELLK